MIDSADTDGDRQAQADRDRPGQAGQAASESNPYQNPDENVAAESAAGSGPGPASVLEVAAAAPCGSRGPIRVALGDAPSRENASLAGRVPL
jgi:hypothetical protein